METIDVFNKKGIEVYLETERDQIKFKADGALSKVVKPILNKLNKILKNEKPISFNEDKLILSTWLPPIPSKPFSRAIKNEIKANLFRKYSPQAVSLNISECTLECEECNIVENKRLSTEIVKDFISEAKQLGAFSLGFAEGEPLVRNDIMELIEYANGEENIVSVFTPGTKLDKETANKLKRKGVYSVITGIKSPNPEEHDEARGVKGAFDEAVSGMKAALENDLLVSMHTHAKPSLVRSGKLKKIYDLSKEIGVDELSIWESHPTWNYLRAKENILNEKDRGRIKTIYKEANNSKEGPRVFYNHIFESKELFGCMAGNRWLNLIHNGDITPCTYVPISFGNIKEEDLKSIWERMSNFRDFKNKKSCVMLDSDFREKYLKDVEPSDLPLSYKRLNK